MKRVAVVLVAGFLGVSVLSGAGWSSQGYLAVREEALTALSLFKSWGAQVNEKADAVLNL